VGPGGDGDSTNCHQLHRPASSIEVCTGAYEYHFGVSPGRDVSRSRNLCGAAHKTAKRVVERAEGGGPPRQPSPRNFDAVTDLAASRLEASNGKISAKRLLPVARAAGYEGSARNFRRLVAEQKSRSTFSVLRSRAFTPITRAPAVEMSVLFNTGYRAPS
jgi:hypothetical protein